MKEYLKTASLGFLGILIYFGLGYFQALPFQIFNVDSNLMPISLKVIYLIIFNILTASLIAMIFHKKLVENYKDIRKNHREYFNKYIKYWLLGLGIMMISNLIINSITDNQMTGNEEIIRETFKQLPIYTYISAVIFAPFLEEIIFRMSLKNIFPNKYIFLAMSGIIFGSLHVITSYTTPTDLLYIIPYGGFGVCFAYIYEKTKNIFVSMGFHFVHNGILMSLQVLILLIS